MRLGRDRAERHRAGHEPGHDRAGRLDLLERHGLDAVGVEVHQPAQRRLAGGLAVGGVGEPAERGPRLVALEPVPTAVGRVGADRVLEQRDRRRVPHVVLAVATPGVDPPDRQQRLGRRRGHVGSGRVRDDPRAGVPVDRLLRQRAQIDAADPRRGAGEVAIDDVRRQPDGLEDLGAGVRRDRRDPHLRDRLEQALADRLDDVLLRRLGVADALDAPLLDELVHGVEHQVRVDRGRAVAEQHREVVDLTGLGRLDDQPGLEPDALAHQVVVHGGDGQRGRDRHPVRAGRPVGQDQHAVSGVDRVGRLVADLGQPAADALGAGGHRPRDVDRVGPEDAPIDLAQRLELVVAQDRVLQRQLVGVLRRLVEQVALAADRRRQRHHDVLADRIDRRVRDLREQLLEVAEQRRSLVGQDRERGVVAHRAERLLGRGGHRREDHPLVLLAVAEGLLELAQVGAGLVDRPARREVGEPHDLLAVPGLVRTLGGDRALDLVVLDHPVLLEVDQEQLAGRQAAEPRDVGRCDVEHAGLGPEDDPAVLGLDPPPGPQPVAVERGADGPAVGEEHRRRAVPRLHQQRVVRVEAGELGREVGPVLERLRDHHHRRVRQRAARQHQQLEHVVEGRRIRAAGADDGLDLLDVLTEQLRSELRLARPHPVDVAHQRVDLAVVGDHAVRVGAVPARERVGREPRVDQRERRAEPRVLQVRVERRHLGRQQHALVDQRARRERRGVELGRRQLADPPDHVELALERVLVVGAGAGLDEQLADVGTGLVGGDADLVGTDGDVAPAEHALALDPDVALQQVLDLGPLRRVLRQEAHADGVAAGRRQLEVHDRAQERVRHLDEDPGPVARSRVRSRCPPMVEVLERGQRALDRLVARIVVQPRDQCDAAGIVLVPGVVEARSRGKA